MVSTGVRGEVEQSHREWGSDMSIIAISEVSFGRHPNTIDWDSSARVVHW